MLEFALALGTGVAIAAACGLRAFLPLLVLGLAARFDLIALRDGMRWLESDAALWTLGVATVLEIAADKLPVVDHALDLVGTAVRPVAAWFAAFAVLAPWPAPWAQLVALALGSAALVVHAGKAKARIASTATTLGAGNPVLSLVEDGLTAGAVLTALLVPLAALLAVVVLLVWAFRVGRPRVRS